MKSMYQYETAIGAVVIVAKEDAITEILFSGKKAIDCLWEETPLLKQGAKQLQEYFDGQRKVFDLPIEPEGTAFQRSVWNALVTIPYGETRTYGQIAAQIGNPKASRAIGQANHNNPIPILIPCHRVIGADGSLTGYGGGLDIKKQLLELEGYAWNA